MLLRGWSFGLDPLPARLAREVGREPRLPLPLPMGFLCLRVGLASRVSRGGTMTQLSPFLDFSVDVVAVPVPAYPCNVGVWISTSSLLRWYAAGSDM